MEYRNFTASQQLLALGFMITVLSICTAKSPLLDYDEANLLDDYIYDDVRGKSDKTTAIEERDKPKPYFTNINSSKIVKENETVVLYCDVKNMGKDNVVVWSNGSSIITQSSHVIGSNQRIHVLRNSAIEISVVQTFDSNKYRCLVLPDSIYHDVYLKVEGTSKVMIYSYNRDVTSRSVTYKEGDEVELECRALNIGNYSIKWSFKGDRVTEGVTPNGKILIGHIDFEKAGKYSCLADDNSTRPPFGSVMVNVNHAPKIFAHQLVVNTIHGDNAALTCEYSANPIATSDWKRNGRPLHRTSNKYFKEDTSQEEKNKTILHVKNVEDSDLGWYECDLQRSCGLSGYTEGRTNSARGEPTLQHKDLLPGPRPIAKEGFSKKEVVSVPENPIGTTTGKVHLVFEPEPAYFDHMEPENYSVILYWQIKSKQELLKVELEYKNNMSESWHRVENQQFQKKAGANTTYIIKHKFSVTPGVWHARIRSKNTAGWSKYSYVQNFQVKEPAVKAHETQEMIVTAGIGNPTNDSKSSRSSSTVDIALRIASLLLCIVLV